MKPETKYAIKVLLILVIITALSGWLIGSVVFYQMNIPHDICPHTNKTDILFFCSMNVQECVNIKFFDILNMDTNGTLRGDINIRDVCFGYPRCDEYKPTYLQLLGLEPRTEKEIKHQYDHLLIKKYSIVQAPSVFLCDMGMVLSGRDSIEGWFKEN